MDVNIGKGITMPVDVEALPAASLEHVIRIGLRNILMDSHANHTSDKPDFVAASREAAERKLASLLAGEVRASAGGGRVGDPVRREAIRAAENIVRNAWRAAGKKLKQLDADRLRSMAETYLGKHPELLEAAAEFVATNRAAAADVDLD